MALISDGLKTRRPAFMGGIQPFPLREGMGEAKPAYKHPGILTTE
jgi:hypothetical protein